MTNPDDPLQTLNNLLKSAQQPLAPETLAQANTAQMSKFHPPGDWQEFARNSGKVVCSSCQALNSSTATICQTCHTPITPV